MTDVEQTGRLSWPDDRTFAFTVVDDTDNGTLERVKPVYDFLHSIGIRTTKTVWPLASLDRVRDAGISLEDAAYRDWILALKAQGFEIGLHGAADGSSSRSRVLEALDWFESILGEHPSIHANHTGQNESLYWGSDRLDGLVRTTYILIQALVGAQSRWEGHDPRSPYFWGDLCYERLKYVRNFVFRDINTTKADKLMPYHDPRRRHVRYWFSSSDGASVGSFCRLLSERNQSRLEAEGGGCIVYTHFGNSFSNNGSLNQEFVDVMCRLASRRGWFVPATTLLEHVGRQRGWTTLDHRRKVIRRMQRRWLLEKCRYGRS